MASASGIYCWKHIESGKRYIGQSNDVVRRFSDHKTMLNSCRHCNDHLQSAWIKYGKDGFEFSVIEYCPEEILDWREIEWIEKYESANRKYGYNILIGGHNSKHTEESKKKLSFARKGIVFSEDHKKKLSEAAKRRGISEETKKKMAEGRKGYPRSEQWKQRISNSLKVKNRKTVALGTVEDVS